MPAAVVGVVRSSLIAASVAFGPQDTGTTGPGVCQCAASAVSVLRFRSITSTFPSGPERHFNVVRANSQTLGRNVSPASDMCHECIRKSDVVVLHEMRQYYPSHPKEPSSSPDTTCLLRGQAPCGRSWRHTVLQPRARLPRRPFRRLPVLSCPHVPNRRGGRGNPRLPPSLPPQTCYWARCRRELAAPKRNPAHRHRTG